MIYNVFNYNVYSVFKIFESSYSQLYLFIIGMFISIVLGWWLLPFVCTIEDCLWYMCSMIVPLVPFMVGMEDW